MVNCSVCKREYEQICETCSPPRYFCKNHGEEHQKTANHPTIPRRKLERINTLRHKKYKSKLKEIIFKITSISESMINEIKEVTNKTVNKLIEINRSVENIEQMYEALVRDEELEKVLKKINKLFNIVDYIQATEYRLRREKLEKKKLDDRIKSYNSKHNPVEHPLDRKTEMNNLELTFKIKLTDYEKTLIDDITQNKTRRYYYICICYEDCRK